MKGALPAVQCKMHIRMHKNDFVREYAHIRGKMIIVHIRVPWHHNASINHLTQQKYQAKFDSTVTHLK